MHACMYLFTGIITGIKCALCRARTFGLDPTGAAAPEVAWTWALCFGGCAAASGVWSTGAPGPNNTLCSQKNILPKQPCAPVCITLRSLLSSPNVLSCWSLVWSFTFGRYQGQILSVVEALMKIYLLFSSSSSSSSYSPPPIILFKWRKQKNVKSAKKITGKWCSWTSSC